MSSLYNHILLPAIGITLIVSYFVIHSRNKDWIYVPSSDTSEKQASDVDTFNNALAMVLSLGSMLTAFGLGSFLSSCSGKTDSTTSVLFYNGAIMVVMILVIVFAFIARGKIYTEEVLDKDNKPLERDGHKSGSTAFIDMIIGLAIIGTLGTGFLVYKETSAKTVSNAFGFDFEF
jgi:hypothetical protein